VLTRPYMGIWPRREKKRKTRNNLEIQKYHKTKTFFASVPGKYLEQNVYKKWNLITVISLL